MEFKTSLFFIIISAVANLLVHANDFFTSTVAFQNLTNELLVENGSCADLKSNFSLNFENVGLQHIASDFINSRTVNCLNLQNNEIDYVSPEAFRLMPNLLYVNLAGNKLSFSNFTYLNGHRYLRTLILDANHPASTENTDIEFKSEFPRLLHLYLRGNGLENVSSLAFAPKLTHLYLSSNNLGNSDLSFLKDAPVTLIHLDLVDNSIRSLNGRGLASVRELRLDGNRIKRLCGKSYCRDSALILEGATELQRLSLAGNALTSVEPDAFDDAEDLLDLDLSFNRIDSIRKSTFEKVEILRKLSLNDNLLSEMPDLCGPESLQYLSLANNRLEIVKSDSFCLIEKLKFLDLSNNQIRMIEPGAFAKLASLEILNLSNNRLVKFPTRWLSSLINLRILYLDGNRLKYLKDIALASVRTDAKLTHVYLRNNLIATFHSSSLFSAFRILPNVTLEFCNVVPSKIVSDNCTCDCDGNNEISA